ncbi:Uncharacterized protein ABJ99_3204 [Pseudomonas syringae pv. cilantro]|uniref:Uncharacterized protein n=1 Tax=Pseudomonas syringae pv. cilantro TaxID=81035 RepID=A0A0N0X855_PSESX|nr:Uncharacterized protein ABJ99_3204 [Pseudomonas syringae pv. cilantro]
MFDNSRAKAELEAEITDASDVEYTFNEVPEWCSVAIEALEKLVHYAPWMHNV